MKWLERRTTDMNDREARQIEKRFGLVGYAMWEKLQQIIAENMDASNYSEWGFVSQDETMESLAEKIKCSVELFREFVTFCDDQLILEKKNGRLFCQYVLDRMNEYARKIAKKSEKGEKGGQSEMSGKSEISENPENPRNNTTQHHTTPHNTKEYISGDTRPEKNTNGISSIAEILGRKTASSPQSPIGLHTQFQEKAFRYAQELNISLDKKTTGRWVKVFKQAYEGRNAANLEKAYSYLRDLTMPGNEKMLMFFKIYENGLTAFQKGGE